MQASQRQANVNIFRMLLSVSLYFNTSTEYRIRWSTEIGLPLLCLMHNNSNLYFISFFEYLTKSSISRKPFFQIHDMSR